MTTHCPIDPLLECLVTFTHLNHKPFTAEALTAGLPVEDGASTPELFSMNHSSSNFSRAASRAGFTSKLVERALNDIPQMVLPCILLLKGKRACILEDVDEKQENVKVLLPELPDGAQWISMEQLQKEYIGFSYYIKSEHAAKSIDKKNIRTHDKHWFWGTMLHSKSIYRDVLFASVIINLFVIAAPLFTMNVYDRVVPNSAIETMWVLAIGIIVVYFLDMVLKFMRTYFLEIAGKKSDVILSSIIFEKVMNLKMAVRPGSVGSFASNLKEFESIRNFFTSTTVATLIDLPFVILFLIIILYISGAIVIIPLIVMGLIVGYSLSVRGALIKSIESTYQANAYKNSVLIESLTNLETIKILGANGHAQYRWEEATGEIANKSLKSRVISSSITTITAFLVQMNTVAVLIVGVYMIEDMSLTMGGLIATVILSSRAIAPMGQFAALLSNYEQTKTSLMSLNGIMELPVERPHGQQFISRPQIDGKIDFKHVDFTYPDETKKTLKNINLTIQPGEKVGIIGRIGSGKSTLGKLIVNLYQANEGSVLVDDIDLQQLDPADLRKQVAYVPQETTLFNGTLRQNIVYKAPHSNDEAILRAAYCGLIDQFVNEHPKGYDMHIAEQGYGLSGGQKQSVTIARAFIQETPIIILDEPSNAMDNTTENILIKRLKEATKDKTTILITHKSSILALVDRLIVMDHGEVILDGPKAQVLASLQKGKNG
jgi:ATP-binding cassette subfamily C protein LapB